MLRFRLDFHGISMYIRSIKCERLRKYSKYFQKHFFVQRHFRLTFSWKQGDNYSLLNSRNLNLEKQNVLSKVPETRFIFVLTG